jgi:uncharacterized membrane protein
MAATPVSPSNGQRFAQIFLTGVVAILPLALTIAVLAWIVNLVHNWAGPSSMSGKLLRSVGLSVVACEATAYIVGVLLALLSVYVLGLLIERGAAKRLGHTFNEVLHRVPVLGTVYDASKQMTSILEPNPDSLKSMTPVMCYFGPNRDAGMPALMPTPELVRIGGKEYHIVIIPTAPVPFGGALLMLQKECVQPAPCGLDELIGIYMSMGVTAPRSLNDTDIKETSPNNLPPALN